MMLVRTLILILSVWLALLHGGQAQSVPANWPSSPFMIIQITWSGSSYTGQGTVNYDPTNQAGCSSAQMSTGGYYPVQVVVTGSYLPGSLFNGYSAGTRYFCYGASGEAGLVAGHQDINCSDFVSSGCSTISVTPAALTCPSGFSVINNSCASCPSGQISNGTTCVAPCPAVEGGVVGSDVDLVGDWTGYIETHLSPGNFYAQVAGSGGTTAKCEVVPGSWSVNSATGNTYVEWVYDGSVAGSSAIAVLSLNGSSANAAPGTAGTATSAQAVQVVNAPGQSQSTPSFTQIIGGSVTATISGTPSVNATITGTPNVNIGSSGTVALTSGTISSIGSTVASDIVSGGGGGGTLGSQSNPNVTAPQTGTGDGTGSTKCCAAGSVVGLPAWPTSVSPFYTPTYSGWSAVSAALLSAISASPSASVLTGLGAISLTASANYNNGYPVIPVTLPTRRFGGSVLTFSMLPQIWDVTRALVLALTAWVCVVIIFRE